MQIRLTVYVISDIVIPLRAPKVNSSTTGFLFSLSRSSLDFMAFEKQHAPPFLLFAVLTQASCVYIYCVYCILWFSLDCPIPSLVINMFSCRMRPPSGCPPFLALILNCFLS